MPATVQLNTRIDPDIKRQGDAVFAAAGLTSSEVVRAVWASAATTQKVPECVYADRQGLRDTRLAAVARGTGIALGFLNEMGIPALSCAVDYAQLHDEMYDELSEVTSVQLA